MDNRAEKIRFLQDTLQFAAFTAFIAGYVDFKNILFDIMDSGEKKDGNPLLSSKIPVLVLSL